MRFKGDLLIGTFNGLYYLDSSGAPPAQLRPFLNIKDRIWDLLVVGDHLFIGFEDGLYLLRQDKRLEKINADAISEMWQSKVDSNRIFVAARKGLSSLYWSDAGWIKEPWDIALGEGAYHINEQEDGTLWLDVNKSWIYRVTFPSVKDAAKLRQASLHKLDTSAGLPGVNGYIMMHDDRIFYVNNRDLNMLYFDPISDRFRSLTNEEAPFSELGKQLVIGHDDDTQNKWLVEFKNGRITQTFLAIVNEGNDIVQELGEDRISDLIGRCMYYDDGVIWHGGSDILVRNDLEKKSNQEPFNTTIHKIYYQDDSLISSGPYRSAEYRFPFSNNRFRFTYGNTSFIANQKEEYQYLLEGYMDDWSSWTSESRRDFTNLKEGAYRFKVRSQTMGGQVGRQDVIEFEILPPWHRSWWAYIIYTLLGILGTGAIVKWRLRQLQKEKIALENLVHLNTAELEVRNEQLMEQKLKLSKQTIALQEMDQFKSRLFANISHEFRTPLTLIKGPLERLKKSPEGKLSEEHIHMMDRNANRLLRLVNQILDLSKLDASDLPLNPAEGNVFKSIRVAASTFSSHAADHNIDYQIMVPATQLWAAFDRDKLEKVIYNLLSNAFKFTGDGGTIKLQASYYQGALRLEVSDTGKGIASGDLPKIFDRFYQIDQSDSRSEEGSGIGLALVKELIQLMQGSIQVESTLDHGSTFFVDLPMEPLNFLTGRITPSPVVLKDSPLPKIPKMDKHPLTESIDLSKVLVIEDNPDMRAYIVEHLQGKYRVLEARNAQEGLKTALVKLPDLIVTDLMMPKMNGLEFCEIVKTDLRISHIPVVILTAKAGIENKLVGLESGADVYLTKPFHGEELSVQINRLIESRSRLRSLFAQQARVDPKDLELPRLDQQFIEKVLEILESRYDDADFDVPKMHQLLAMSRTQLHRKIKALTGQAPGEFIRHFRLKRAAQILIRGENVAQTAYAVGFNNLSYFARSFRALHGVSPKEYANQHREG